ncbi:hypothetical protein Q2941_26015 [Bradyrhizobium sp. UFLA05-153]
MPSKPLCLLDFDLSGLERLRHDVGQLVGRSHERQRSMPPPSRRDHLIKTGRD